MKLTPLSRIILLMLVLGGVAWAYRTFAPGKVVPGSGTTANSKSGGFALPKIPGLGGNSGNRGNDSGANDGAGTSDNGGDTNNAGELQFITSASKKGWIVQQIDKFNALPTTKTPIVLKSVETRQAMQQILAGRAKPALWSPSSVIWADRLSEA